MDALPLTSAGARSAPAVSPLATWQTWTTGRSARGPLHVVIVDEELPYPANSGKRIRTLNLTLRLARRHRVTYLCHRNADPAEARAAEQYFQAHGIATVVVERAVPRKSGVGFYARLAANLFSPLPYSVATHNSPALRSALRAYADRNTVDLWQCEWTPYAEALRTLPTARRLIIAHNVESQIWRRYAETETNPLKRWYIGRQCRKFARFERRAHGDATGAVAVSSEDAGLLQKHFRARNVAVVENGVDTAFFRPSDERRRPERILFLGSLDWRPNLDGVRLLLDDVFPLVRVLQPGAELCIVGRNPPAWLQARVTRCLGAELHANVADVRPFLTGCAVLAVPLRIGGGSRLKILEALACATPVVATRVGAEGLKLEAGRHLDVVENVDDMPSALVRCLREPAIAQAQAAQGRSVVLKHYDWDVLAQRLERVWFDCVGVEN